MSARRIAAGAIAVFAVVAGLRLRRLAAEAATPRDLHGVAYAGSDACGRCHEDNHRSWHRTFHRTMTAEATPASVLGAFDGATLRHDGVAARMDRDAAGAFRVTFTPDGGPPRAVTVARTVGSHRYQQYLAKEGDTYWRLPVAWHVEEERWFPMTGAFLFADDTRLDGPGRPVFGGGLFDRHVTRWNDNCVFCHNVAPDPGLDAATGRFATTTAELGVACEACHGPGAAHVAANADPLRRLWLRARGAADPTIVNPARLPPRRSAAVCGRCHGQRIAADVGPFLAHGDPFVPGDDLAPATTPLWRDTALRGERGVFAARFWGDGTPRLTAYEYQGLLQSRCAREGQLTCTSCHGMHEGDPRGQVRARFRGAGADGMCTQCHAALADAATSARHSRHAERDGVRCVSCHMPRIVYGVLDIHRSHRVEIPDAAGAAAAGRPDACAGCHVERAFAGGAPSTLEALVSGGPVTRAVAADALGRAQVTLDAAARRRREAALLDTMASDAYPAVRHLAARALGRLGVTGARDYDPSGEASSRAAAVERLRRGLGARSEAPPPRPGGGPREDIEIGE
ncbi:MAG TPA: multiheme c-type cytochrome [Polyangia bacterium]|nr:multiheme c-type cytochrome [Polyangia bacterium]